MINSMFLPLMTWRIFTKEVGEVLLELLLVYLIPVVLLMVIVLLFGGKKKER